MMYTVLFAARQWTSTNVLQHETPEDFVIATSVQHSVREFCYLAFKYAGIELEFKGEGINEKGYDKATGKCLVEVSEDFYRPTDVVNLWGDPTKAGGDHVPLLPRGF